MMRWRGRAQATLAARGGAGASKPFYQKWWFWALCAFLIVAFIVNLTQKSDVGGEHMQSHPTNEAWSSGERVPTDEERKEYLGVWNSSSTSRQRDNATKARIKYEEYLLKGDTSEMVEHFAIATATTLSSDPALNVDMASAYFQTIGHNGEFVSLVNGEVQDTNMTPERVEEILEQHALEQETKANELSDMKAGINSFNSSGFLPEDSGIIQIDGDKFVQFEDDDGMKLTGRKEDATPIGIMRGKLVKGGGARGMCYPFSDSVGFADESSSARLKRHPCLNEGTFAHDVVMDGNKISELGGKCFGFGSFDDEELQLSSMRCNRGTAEAMIVDPDGISSSAENGGLGTEDPPE